MPANPGQQKKAAKQKKKREAARKKHAPHVLASRTALLRQLGQLPHGPSYVSADFQEASPDRPGLVSVVVTRKAPDGRYLAGLALVDRTCLGVKNGFAAEPMSELDLHEFVRQVGSAHPGGLVPCELLVAQSIVYHALDYAASLGFEPHHDFPEPLFGPRPATLADTPLARPARPYYMSGPDDDVDEILATLEEAVGAGNFDFVV